MGVITYEREYRKEFQGHTSTLERLAKVEQERDTLLAALKPFIEWVDSDAGVMFQVMGPGGDDTIDWPEDTNGNALLHKMRAAIAAVEGV